MKYVILILILLVYSMLIASTRLNKDVPKNTYVIIHNPFDSSFKIDLKCNWDGKKWKILKRYELKARGGTKVEIPHSSKCQIWPVF